MNKLKVAIISCGMISTSAHIPAYQCFLKDYEIVGVCDINEKVAEETAKKYNIPHYYIDSEKMLTELSPDIVSVCVPNKLHKEVTMSALRHGCHVLCEKPVAVTYKDAVEMYRLAKEKGKYLIACQSMRFTADRLAAKEFISKGNLGEIYYAEFSRIRNRGIPQWGTAHIQKYSGGGAFLDIGVHMVDAVLWLMGNPDVAAVSAMKATKHNYDGESDLVSSGAFTGTVENKRLFRPEEMDVEDFSNGLIRFKNGVMINFKVAWAANLPDETTIKIVGTKAGVVLPDAITFSGKANESVLEIEADQYETRPFSGHYHLIKHLAEVLHGHTELIIKPEETINTALILEMFYRSAELGREVTAEEITKEVGGLYELTETGREVRFDD